VSNADAPNIEGVLKAKSKYVPCLPANAPKAMVSAFLQSNIRTRGAFFSFSKA
jgi:hypothetical protein